LSSRRNTIFDSTVGCLLTAEYAGFILTVREKCPELQQVGLLAHCHELVQEVMAP
jgi:isopropylmalate/homocitrate/citramalate synthase